MSDLGDLAPLRAQIESARRETGAGLDDLSAMSAQRDPYRRDTPAHRRDAAWIAEQIDRHVRTWTIHPRGLHYLLVSVAPVKPDGKPITSPLLDPADDWITQTRKLAQRKSFET